MNFTDAALEPFRFAGRLLDRGRLEVAHRRLLRAWPRREAEARAAYFSDPRAAAEGILIVQPADIGDMVLTSVFLRRLRAAFPSERIVVAAAPLPAALLRACPLVDAVTILDAKGIAGPDWITRLHGHEGWWEAAAALREAHFPAAPPALALSLRGERDALAAAAQIVLASSRARLRVGYRLKTLYGTLRSDRLLDLALPLPTSGHETARQGLLLAAATGTPCAAPTLPELWIAPEAQARAAAIWADLRSIGTSDSAHVILGIGAGKPEKKWPKDRFAALARHLQTERGLGIVFLGGPEDRADAEEIAALGGLDPARTANLAGELPLDVAAALVGGAALFIGNDSGPMHLAAASPGRIPVLGLFGAQDMERWRPLSPRFRAVQEPDLASLPAERVLDEAAALMRACALLP